MTVMHFNKGVGAGGAEAMLYKLALAARVEGVRQRVVCLVDATFFAPKLAAEGIPVESLGMRRGVPNPLALARLVRLVRSGQPDVIQGWMYHANLLASLAAAVTGTPVVWGIHHADVDARHSRRLTAWTRALSARLSSMPARIVCCADSALASHASIGYRAGRMVVIPNGFLIERFAPDAAARARVRQELSVPDAAPIVAIVARVHPDKDHQNFIAAAAIVAKQRPDAVFVAVGEGAAWSNAELAAAIDALGLRSRVRLLGLRDDVHQLLPAMDVLVQSSRAEGFPQVLGEAMLCGVPCAATDVGDSREIVGPTGRIARPRNPAALGTAVLELLSLSPEERAALGAEARRRIVERYDLRAVALRYRELWAEVSTAGRSRARPQVAGQG
jgi:glycosyltransferase involved in cell wall biosynthesis